MVRLIMVIAIAVLATAAAAQTTDLLITEYVEGSVNNNAVEISNGTSDTINLGGYAIERYSNGSTSATSIALSAVDLEPGEAWVLAHTSFSQPGLADQMDVGLNFDGNDALVLVYNSTPIDRIGRVGEDPGEYWSCANGTTQNHTLRRIAGVCTGEEVPDAPFDPCDSWMFFPMDDFDDLGDHTSDCGVVDAQVPSWGSVKALYR